MCAMIDAEDDVMKNYNIYELLYLYHSGSLYASNLIQEEMSDYLFYWTDEKVELNRNCYRMYFDDLYQEAVLGLYDAIDSYRDDKEASFITFSKRIITGRLINFISRTISPKSAPKGKIYSLDEESMYPDCDYLNIPTTDYLSLPEYKLAFNECITQVNEVISCMSVSDKNIVDRWTSDMSYQEASASLNLSKKKYDGRLQKVKKLIRNTCKNQYSA